MTKKILTGTIVIGGPQPEVLELPAGALAVLSAKDVRKEYAGRTRATVGETIYAILIEQLVVARDNLVAQGETPEERKAYRLRRRELRRDLAAPGRTA